jgi:hypothetical protein
VRRRPRAADAHGAPPLPLAHYRGTTNREALAWIRERGVWWDATHADDERDQVGVLRWTMDGWDRVGDLHWCSSIGAPCNNPDCLCTTWPEHLAADDPESKHS